MYLFFFFNDTATTEIYTLSLHDALPISRVAGRLGGASSRPAGSGSESRPISWSGISVAARGTPTAAPRPQTAATTRGTDRESTRLNSSHANISYAVFCLKKKKTLHT